MKISVVLPSHCRPQMLKVALESLEVQTFRPHEIIVVQNGPKDGYELISKSDVTFIEIAEALNPGGAANIGAAKATGDYIAFHEDDDYWSKTYLEEIRKEVESSAPNLLVAKLSFVNDRSTLVTETLLPKGSRQRSVLHSNPGITGHNLVVKTRFFRQIGGFDPTLRSSQDRDFLIRAILAGSFAVPVQTAVAHKLIHAGGQISDNVLAPNRAFFLKHWRKMSPSELVMALTVLTKRHVFSWFGIPQDLVFRLRHGVFPRGGGR